MYRFKARIWLVVALTSACGQALPGAYSKLQGQGTTPVPALTSQPNPKVTPGTLCTPDNANFLEYRYPEHIAYCNRVDTTQMKLQISAAYGIVEADWSKYEFDHYIPLGIGGSSDVSNIWPQPKGEASVKDGLENKLYSEMAKGTIKQADAVAQIRAWH